MSLDPTQTRLDQEQADYEKQQKQTPPLNRPFPFTTNPSFAFVDFELMKDPDPYPKQPDKFTQP